MKTQEKREINENKLEFLMLLTPSYIPRDIPSSLSLKIAQKTDKLLISFQEVPIFNSRHSLASPISPLI